MASREEEQRAYFQAKLDKGRERIEKIKGKYKAFNLLVDVAGDELERANDAYMELGDTEEAWTSFNEHCERACWLLKCAILTLNELSETEPSCVDPQIRQWLDEVIDDIGNIRIKFWERWGKPVKADRRAVQRPGGILSCPAMLYHRGVKDMAEQSAEDTEWCVSKCPYQDRCDSPIPHPKP